ncbi:hypothetical protein BV20DRAFT_950872 [Pilatotrama ljubarskyi]|nr:hypothetical protein BV20DRAFT_950872 [Pilatotrama ljubarskyi]
MPTRYARTVGHIDELLVMIFSYLDDRALSRAACVCTHWSEIALDCLWHEVTDLRRALTVLAPLSLKQERASSSSSRGPNAYAFKRPLTADDWQRFQRYSYRVRRLRHDQRHVRASTEKVKRHVPLHPKVFDELSATCPYPDIFPNLQSLTWFSCVPSRQHLSLTFMHRRVKHLGLHMYRSEPQSLTAFLQQVCSRCAGVTSLELRLAEPMRDLEDGIVILLRGFGQLQQVSLPIFSLTPRVLTELSTLKHVVAITAGHPAQAEPGDRRDVADFSPTIPEDAFITLRGLTFSAQLPDATRLLNTSLFPARLTRLHIKTVRIATSTALRDFFCVVQARCTSLVDLSVDYIIAPDSPIASPPPLPQDRPSITTFRPLFSARSIRIFEFRWDYALNLSDDDMEEFAGSWPSLESLQLHPEPVPEPNGPTLSLRALIPFARHCANLRYLALHIDASEPSELSHLLRSPGIMPFRRLETLAVGLSAITKAEPVTLFLSQLLPLGCPVSCGLRWPDAFDLALEHALVPLEVRTEMSTFWMRWTEVAKLLPVATKARLEEKARFAALERQMQALEVSRSEDRRRLTHLEREVEDLRYRTGRTP